MRLIGLAVVLTLALTLAPLAADAQQPVKSPRIGMLLSGTLVDPAPRVAALRQALRGRGYVDGQNIAIEPRRSDDIPRLYDLATDQGQSKVDVIVTQSTPGVQAAQRATRTTPIVMAASGATPSSSASWRALRGLAETSRAKRSSPPNTLVSGWRFCGQSFPAFRAFRRSAVHTLPLVHCRSSNGCSIQGELIRGLDRALLLGGIVSTSAADLRRQAGRTPT
jgi:hypothetical protein